MSIGSLARTWATIAAAVVLLTGCIGEHLSIGEAGPAAQAQADSSIELRLRGNQALADGRWDEARRAFSELVRIKPGDEPALLGLAEISLAGRDVASAKRFIERAGSGVRLGDGARLAEIAGRIALAEGDNARAERRFREAVAKDDQRWRAFLGLGRALAHEDGDRAREAFHRAREAGAPEGVFLNHVGMSYLVEKRPVEAADRFDQALEHADDRGPVMANLRIARAMAGDYAGALSGALDGELADTLNNVGYVALMNRDLEAADRYLRQALQASPVYHARASANLALLEQARTQDRRRASAEPARPAGSSDIREPDRGPWQSASEEGLYRELTSRKLQGSFGLPETGQTKLGLDLAVGAKTSILGIVPPRRETSAVWSIVPVSIKLALE